MCSASSSNFQIRAYHSVTVTAESVVWTEVQERVDVCGSRRVATKSFHRPSSLLPGAEQGRGLPVPLAMRPSVLRGI
jgi:hypothetical protein